MKKIFIFYLLIASISLFSFQIDGNINKWQQSDLVGFDKIGDSKLGDISSVYLHKENNQTFLRITFNDMIKRLSNKTFSDRFKFENIIAEIIFGKETYRLDISQLTKITPEYKFKRTPENNLLEISFPKKLSSQYLKIKIIQKGKVNDAFSYNDSYRGGNCAFVHHGNQGLTYTEVFYGQYPQESSGYDEVLQVHQATGIPGNFHMSGTLMPAAQWHNPEFNAWLRQGISEGWVAMITSALGQHIMPFVTNDMNNWSVHIEKNMINYIYNYDAKVAWIPERVWLAQGHYPDAGVIDWLGDNWQQFGIQAVILDDTPHLNGASNTKIHWMSNASGVTLRVIPINNDFVGKVMYDVDGAKNLIASTGQYGIAVYGTDWEVAAEMNEHHDTSFLDNYENLIWWCHDNYPGINVWKLDSAIDNPDFNGNTVDITPGTYWLLGGDNGYGGSNNSWYINWASTVSHSDFHNPNWNYGYIWYDAFEHLMQSPDNNLSQLGWYNLMINLHETGWHEGGEVASWEHRYSSHIKNSNVYAEASRWANGEFEENLSVYWDDIDRDGIDELIMYNQYIFSVFETVGGRASWIFIKDNNGNATSVVGSDVAYWSETDGDYNESSNNHFAAFSDVSPFYQNELYEINILENENEYIKVEFIKNNLHRILTLYSGEKFIRAEYHNNSEVYIKSGFSPDLLDMIWNGKSHIQRMWGDNASYCGRRNSQTAATISYILGNGGANHSSEFEGTLVMGDEIHGNGNFKFFLFAGFTPEPYDEYQNHVAELDTLAQILSDDLPPQILYQKAFKVGSNKILLAFNENINIDSAENIENYQLINFANNYNVISAKLHHRKGVTLKLDTPLENNDWGDVVVSNVADLNGNAILPENNTVHLYPISYPHIVGNMNQWNPQNHQYELELQDNGLWTASLDLPAGTYEYKILESDEWNGNDWPSNNQTFETNGEEPVIIYANCGLLPFEKNGDEFEFHSTNPPVVCGDFLSELGYTDWDVSTTETALNDNAINGDQEANDGIYSAIFHIPAGDYEYKIVLNNNWEQNTSSQNIALNLQNDSDVMFFYDMAENITYTNIQADINENDIQQADMSITKIYPNPFILKNSKDIINLEYQIDKEGYISLNLYNLKGQIVKKIVNNQLVKSGKRKITFKIDNLSSGIYFIKLQNEKNSIIKKIVIFK